MPLSPPLQSQNDAQLPNTLFCSEEWDWRPVTGHGKPSHTFSCTLTAPNARMQSYWEFAVNNTTEQWVLFVASLPTTPEGWALLITSTVGAVSLLTYFIPFFLSLFHFKQDLKKRYNATWALITGAYTGAAVHCRACHTRVQGSGRSMVPPPPYPTRREGKRFA